MEGMNNTSQSMGVGQPHHPVNHTRPFFYVQPPSQPYYMYQWPMNPYGHYGFPGPAALHYSRPYMAPYQYMQYPGYVIPHAPVQPVDYRRINPHFPSVASYDLRVRHHFQHAAMQRETACSEVQTDPSDSVNKLMDKIESLKVCEQKAGDKGANTVVSSTPDVIQGEKLISLNEESKLELASQEGQEEQGNQVRPTTYSDSAYDGESSQGRLDDCVLSDVLPLDSSSVHEEEDVVGDDHQQSVSDETSCQNDKSPTSATGNVFCSGVMSTTGLTECHDLEMPDLRGDAPSEFEQVQNISSDVAAEPLIQLSEDFELPYQILRLPCNKATTGLSLEREIDPLVYFESPSTLSAQNYLSSIGGAYSFSYYPQVVQERQSVLSPSIDELSSRDEMFSTDAEDLDLIPGHVYVSGGRLAETSEVPICSRKELLSAEKSFFGSQKACACCGSSLQDEGQVCKLPEHCSHPERDLTNEVSDQECEYDIEGEVRSSCESPRVSKRKGFSRHALPLCGHHCAKHRHRKLVCEGQESCELRELARVHSKGDCCEEHGPLAKADKRTPKGSLCRPCTDRQWREGVPDQETWASCGAKPRSWRQVPGSQDQGRMPLRRPCKTRLQQRPRSEYDDCETDFTYCQRGRGNVLFLFSANCHAFMLTCNVYPIRCYEEKRHKILNHYALL
ncbi:bucky ball isoform X2 [Triplophysa dalaica]|uniref:bucky ball isoform X2 n=1 Tax=Triplophysa dalaica TaxID=1582913 RepID=UPI0024DF6DEC|nr:bucky ball isoform X2 [Triplophysa dalaica]